MGAPSIFAAPNGVGLTAAQAAKLAAAPLIAEVANDFDPTVSGLSTATIGGSTVTLKLGDLARTVDGTTGLWQKTGAASTAWFRIL